MLSAIGPFRHMYIITLVETIEGFDRGGLQLDGLLGSILVSLVTAGGLWVLETDGMVFEKMGKGFFKKLFIQCLNFLLRLTPKTKGVV